MKTDYQIKKTFFRNNPKYGRTTQLIEKISGKIMIEIMGVCTLKDAYTNYLYHKFSNR